MKYRLAFIYTLNPLLYLDGGLREAFELCLAEHGAAAHFPGLHALQRRHQWALELPLGAFTNNYTPGAVTRAQERRAYEDLTDPIQPKQWHATRDVFERDGVLYVRKPFLERVRKVFEYNAIFEAAYSFMVAAEADRTLIKGKKPRRPPISVEERVARFGRVTRGLGWSHEEDAVLRRWFGVRTFGEHAGRHVRLNDEEWGYVLEALGGTRTRDSVQRRLAMLNLELRDRMKREGKIVDGYITAIAASEYSQHALGERPRVPPQRPTYKRRRRKDASASRHVASDHATPV